MDSEGNIYLFSNHPNPQKFIEDYDLVEIPEEELPVVMNMNQKDKKKWYKENKVTV